MVQPASVRGGVFIWNLSADVGPNQPNKLDDVELVRLGYFFMKDNPKALAGPFIQMKPVLDQVRPNGPFDNDLAAAIQIHQQIRGGTQDGRVSVAKSLDFTRGQYDRSHTWIIFPLNNNMIDLAGDIYPRLDLHPLAGPGLKPVVRRICLHE